MYARSVSTTTSNSRAPMNNGTGSFPNGTRSRFSRACSIGSNGLRSFSSCCVRSRSCSSSFSLASARRRCGSSRSDTTPTTREASSTCTVGREYAGAIRTAVCCFEVVAPPISSGRSSPRRSISFATLTISSSDDVIRPDSTTTLQPSTRTVSRILCAVLDVVDDRVHERVRQSLLDGRVPPREIDLALHPFALHGGRVLDEPLRRIGAAVEDHVLDALAQLGLDVLVGGELARVDDP